MRFKKTTNLSIVDHLVITDQRIIKVDDFKYLGSYFGSTEYDVQVIIGHALTELKLKPIKITETKAESQNSTF